MIDRKSLSIIVPINTTKGLHTFYIPDLPKERVEVALPVLGHLYFTQKKLGYPPEVVVQDYEYYARQACRLHASVFARDSKDLEAISEKIWQDFSSFVMAAFNGASVVMPDFKTEQYPAVADRFTDAEKTRVEGYVAFFSAVLRYAYQTLDESEMGDLTSSLPLSEFAKHLMTSSSKSATSAETPPD